MSKVSLNGLTLLQLEAAIAARKDEMAELQQQADQMETERQKLLDKIMAIKGETPVVVKRVSKKTTKRQKNGRPLVELLLEAMHFKKQPMGASELARSVLKSGYKTASHGRTFLTSIGSRLSADPRFQRVGPGRYVPAKKG